MNGRSSVLSSAAVALALGVGSIAKADTQVDLTQLSPGYENSSDIFVNAVEPGFTETANSNQLTIVGQPNLTSDLSTHNTIWLPTTGNFSATIDSTVSSNAGGGFFTDFSNGGGYAGVGYNSNVVYGNYGFGNGNVATPNAAFTAGSITLDISRVGDVLSVSYIPQGGNSTQILSLSGANVLGPVGFDLTGYGTPGVDAPVTTTYSNFVVSSSIPGNDAGLQGGSASSPTMLPTSQVSSISGNIGGSAPNSDYYSFYWGGGAFEAFVGVPDAPELTSPPNFEFVLCNGTSCNVDPSSDLEDVFANISNDWENMLSEPNLAAGFYTVGIIEDSSSPDPQFNIVFATPVSSASVPEPATLGVFSIGVMGIGAIRRRKFSSVT